MRHTGRKSESAAPAWRSFELLCSHWRGLGVWLSLWDDRGHCLTSDEVLGGPFRVLWQHSSRFRSWVGDLSRQATRQASVLPTPARAEMAGLIAFAVPVLTTGRTRKVVVAVLVPQGFRPDEQLLELCDQAQLTPAMLGQLAQDVAWHDPRAIAGLQELLGLLVDQLGRDEQIGSCMESLAANLAQTYEVLNLIHHVSDKFDGRQRPDEFFERTFAEVLAVLQVESLAAVTHAAGHEGEPTVIVVGKCPTHRAQIHTIAEALSSLMLDRKMLLFDERQVRAHLPQEQWLRNLVAVWLLRQGEPVGALLAINKAPGREFDAVDLQLLQVVAERCSIYLEDLHILADLQELLIALLRSLVSSIDAMDPYTSGHSERVALVSRRLAEALNCNANFCQRAYFGGLLHDVGKIGIPGSVLRKPSSLTPEELRLIQGHPVSGARLIERIQAMHDIVPAVRGHHERVDGGGYPEGLRGEQIPPLARIVAVADCFDAITSKRAYRPAREVEQARGELAAMAGTHLDERMVSALLDMDLPDLHGQLDGYHSGLRATERMPQAAGEPALSAATPAPR